METKDIINSLIDDILDGNNSEAQEKFDYAIASKVVDVLDARKRELAQTIYSSQEDGTSEEEQSTDAAV